MHESPLSKGITPPKPPIQNPDATLWGTQSQHEAPRMTQTVSNHLMQTSQPAPQHAVQSAVGAMCQPTQEDPQAARHDLSQLHAVPRQVVNSHGILYPPHPVPSSSQTQLVSSHLAAPLLQTSRNSTSHHPKHGLYQSWGAQTDTPTAVREWSSQNLTTLTPQSQFQEKKPPARTNVTANRTSTLPST